MTGRKSRDVAQYGDFQTPPDLAEAVCALLARLGVSAPAILEPTCGRGAFLKAAAARFPSRRLLLGVERNAAYVAEARLQSGAQVEQGDVFAVDWDRLLGLDPGPWLILGNPPWATSAGLGRLESANLPQKRNLHGSRGLEAVTGKANFDISEWLLFQHLLWLKARSGWIAMLTKTSVARKILRQAWRRGDPVGRASIFRIDAMRHFGASVEACLFLLPVNLGASSQSCDVYADLDAPAPASTIGFDEGALIADMAAYAELRDLIGPNPDHVWRSGIKHDSARTMELTRSASGGLVNGAGEPAALEESCLFPLLKGSDVAAGRTNANRLLLLPQRRIGEDTAPLASSAPKTWAYLLAHAAALDRRKSVVYRRKPRFSIFGVGDYAFAPWKVAVSGFCKALRFLKVGPLSGKPVVFDDTVYFLPCRSEAEADLLLRLTRSAPYGRLATAMIFPESKRPVTAELLRRVSLERVAARLGLLKPYRLHAAPQP